MVIFHSYVKFPEGRSFSAPKNNNCPCLQLVKDSGKMIVMELAKGGELGEYLEKTGKMTEEKAKGAQIFPDFFRLFSFLGYKGKLVRFVYFFLILLC